MARIMSASIGPLDEAVEEVVPEQIPSPDRSIGLSGTGAAEGGEEDVGPAGDVVVVDSFA